MNHEINEINQFDRIADFSNFGLDPHDPIHGITEKDRTAIGNPPEHLDLEAWEDRSSERKAGAIAKTDTTQQWLKQFGSSSYDYSSGIATDKDGNIYLTGSNYGNLEGNNDRGYDAWVAKYNSNGDRLWIQQFGSSESDESYGIATDKSNNVYITGYTGGDLAGTNSGSNDVWVAKYDSNGDRLWIQQFGSSNEENSNRVAIDNSGNVYLTGYTYGNLGNLAETNAGSADAWVAKYASNGDRLWAKQFGSSESDYSNGIAIDNNDNLYLTGITTGDLAGTNTGSNYDAWIAKYNSNGDRLWAKQFGTVVGEFSRTIATDKDGNIYLTGSTDGVLAGQNLGLTDVWVAKYASNGDRLWTKQFGSSNSDYSYAITTDSNSNLYLTGYTYGDLAERNAGESDVWVAKYDNNGERLWAKQFGSFNSDYSYAITTDSNDNVYLTGYTGGNLAGKNAGESDAWVAKTISLLSTQPIVTINATDAVAAETISSETSNPGEFIITRTGDKTNSLTINYSVDGEADNDIDYQGLTGSVIIPAGKTQAFLPLEVIDDNKSEYRERVTIALKSNFFYGVDTVKSATVTIADNDKSVVSTGVIDPFASENKTGEIANPAKFKVRRTGELSNPLTVTYKVSSTATKDIDYKLPKKINFAAGVSAVVVPMNIVDDALIEGQERANVILTSSLNYNLAKAKIAKVSIADNDK